MDIYTLDIETRPLDGSEFGALEPWRVRQGKAEIASISGSSGIIENILSDETIESDTDADTTATALLNENGERVQEITCELPDIEGTDIGTAWELNHPSLGIVGVFVVTEKNIFAFSASQVSE